MMMTAATRDRAKNNTDWGNLNQRLRLLRKKTAADRVSVAGRFEGAMASGVNFLLLPRWIKET